MLTLKRLLNITLSQHLSENEVKEVPEGAVVLCVVAKNSVYYFFKNTYTYDPNKRVADLTESEGVIIPVKLLEPKALDSDGRRCQLVGCRLDDFFSYRDLGKRFALIPCHLAI